MVWRQAGPFGSVMIGAITLTSCAMQAILTTSERRMKVLRMQPTCSDVLEIVDVLEQPRRVRPALRAAEDLAILGVRMIPDVPFVEGDRHSSCGCA